MNRNLLEEYDKVLARLENESWVTKAIVFEVLAIHDKERLDEIIAMDDNEFKETMLELGKI